MRYILFAATALAFVMPQGSEAKSVKSEFIQAWGDRSARYQVDAQQKQVALQTASAQADEVVGSRTEAAQQNVIRYFDASGEYGHSQGRLIMLTAFKNFIKSKPSEARLDMWMQEQAQSIKDYGKSIDAKLDEIKAIQSDQSKQNSQSVMHLLGEHAFMVGMNKGMIDEILLVQQNLDTFNVARREESARRAAMWGALAKSMSDMGRSMQQPVPPPPPLVAPKTMQTTNCHTNGQNTTCTTM